MIRCRFKQPTEDPRPVNWPITHPYWVTGFGDGYSTLVAYADDGYQFSDRFKQPGWFKG